MLGEKWKSNDAVPGWQSNMRKHLAELSYFHLPKIYILVYFTADIKKCDTIVMWTTDNPERTMKDLKLT